MNSLSTVSEALGRVYSYNPQPSTSEEPAGMTITISREEGTPAGEVAHAVANILGWKVYDHQLVEMVAHDLGKPVSRLKLMDEMPLNWLVECFEGFHIGNGLSESRYVHRLAQVIRKLGMTGHSVIVGRGAGHILPARSTLRIRLVAPLEDRIAAYSRRHGMTYRQATRRVHELDRGHDQFVQKHFHHDNALAEEFDLVINTSQWMVDRCASLIVDAARAKMNEWGR